MNKCFYHSADLDGHCSGAIVKYFIPDTELYGINYGEAFPWDEINKDDTVYMVDFSLQPFEYMIKLNNMCNFIWIDHHISAIKEYEKSGVEFKGRILDGIGACSLTWEYMTEKRRPEAVRMLAEYDVWDHSDSHTLPFQYGLRMRDTFPDQIIWRDLFDGPQMVISDTIRAGNLILKYEASQNKKYCDACSFEVKFKGLKCIAINKMLTNSKIFESVWDDSKYDAMLAFGYRKGKWTFSLYTDKEGVDVSEVAKSLGGGGHKQAAGFQLDYLPAFGGILK